MDGSVGRDANRRDSGGRFAKTVERRYWAARSVCSIVEDRGQEARQLSPLTISRVVA